MGARSGRKPDAAALAAARLGATSEARLAWVVDFTRRDLGTLRPAERPALAEDLRALWRYGVDVPADWMIAHRRDLTEPARLEALQSRMGEALDKLTWSGWQPPAPTAITVTRLNEATEKPAEFRVQYAFKEEDDAILYAVWDLVRSTRRLVACGYCERPFVGSGKRKFCSPTCTQRAMEAKRRAKGPRQRGGE